jgi:hypothetical protein
MLQPAPPKRPPPVPWERGPPARLNQADSPDRDTPESRSDELRANDPVGSSENEVYVGRNDIGGSTCNREFTGEIISCDPNPGSGHLAQE